MRNPFQVNSKPTSRKESYLSVAGASGTSGASGASSTFAEGNEEEILSSHNSRKQSLQEENCSYLESFNEELSFPLDCNSIWRRNT